jgi:two-component system, chemotaxis family, protein-glutamate methylesterase/glutaminase
MNMSNKGHTIIVVGASAGGLDALSRLVASLPKDFPAALLVVQHMSADTTGEVLVKALAKSGKLGCKHAQNGEAIRIGHIYVAPSDHHMLISKGKILISKGARENRSRPAIDPLFRSAAVAFGPKLIGVVLTGYLDDGTIGLKAIKRCGGICIVQDPKDAKYPDMPQNALDNVEVDYCLPLSEIGECLAKLVHRQTRKPVSIPKDIAMEAKIAERVLSDVSAVEELGNQVPFNCPNCGGVLWEMKDRTLLRYRCHTGHSYTANVLLVEQTKKIEETLWVALRMFEERKNLLNTMANPKSKGFKRSAVERAREFQVHIERIRDILLSGTEEPDD